MDPESTPESNPEPNSAEFTRLLEYLRTSRGFDFGAYKVSTLMRRVQKRMREVGVASFAHYGDYLEVHPDEFIPLFNTVLINVTSFFRDPDVWQYVREHIVPDILEGKSADMPIRVWSAGCASGEEAYTLAMVLAEVLGEEEFRQRVKIYATDADSGALNTARQGIYEPKQVEGVPPEMLEKYFEPSGSRLCFRNELRRCLIFGRHDLIQDPAISRLDLLVCRNTLMYFNAEAQSRILARFHFALGRAGYLLLGRAETLLSQYAGFKPVDLKHRVFTRATTNGFRDRLLALAPMPPMSSVSEGEAGARYLRIREAALDAAPAAQIAVDRRGCLVMVNERARRLFKLGSSDVGRLLQDLEVSYRPLELRARLEEVYEARTPIYIKDVEWRAGSTEPRLLEVQIIPLFASKEALLGASITFLDLTQAHQLRTELMRTNSELETAYEELQSSNEELETTNEELQSTVEELETTNEELQSANEELETMNEEFQSTNEELRNLNDEIQRRSEELNRVNGYFQTVLTGLRAGVAVLDRDLQVRVWSDKAADLWGVRVDEAQGRSFDGLDIGLPVHDLREDLRQALAGAQREHLLDGVNRRGKAMRCRVVITPHFGSAGVEGLVLLMEEINT